MSGTGFQDAYVMVLVTPLANELSCRRQKIWPPSCRVSNVLIVYSRCLTTDLIYELLGWTRAFLVLSRGIPGLPTRLVSRGIVGELTRIGKVLTFTKLIVSKHSFGAVFRIFSSSSSVASWKHLLCSNDIFIHLFRAVFRAFDFFCRVHQPRIFQSFFLSKKPLLFWKLWLYSKDILISRI